MPACHAYRAAEAKLIWVVGVKLVRADGDNIGLLMTNESRSQQKCQRLASGKMLYMLAQTVLMTVNTV